MANGAANLMGISSSDDSNGFDSTNYPTLSMKFDTEARTSHSLETDWSTTPTSDEVDGRENKLFSSNLVMPVMGDQNPPEASSSQGSTDLPDASLFWTHISPTDFTSPHLDNVLQLQPSKMTDTTALPSVTFWLDQTDSTHFPNSGPCDARLGPLPNLFMDECLARPATCDCFNSCLQVLQTLNNFNAVPPASSFDMVLTINQKAMETCSATLHCPICNSRSGSSLRIMLLGTILGRIILIYQDTSKNYFGPSASQGSELQQQHLTFGLYNVASEDVRWLQLVIILRDLKKFKMLLNKFQEASMESQSQEDVEMHSAVTNHLYQSLHLTCEALKKYKNSTWGQVD